MVLRNAKKVLMNKKLLYIITVIIFCASCIKTTQKISGMKPKSDYLEFSIEYRENEIQLYLHNITNDTITVNRPSCYGRYIMPFLIDSTNDSAPVIRAINVRCGPSPITLSPNETHNEKFKYTLDHLFGMESGKKYSLFFKYGGNVLRKKRRSYVRITNDTPLRSNSIEIFK